MIDAMTRRERLDQLLLVVRGNINDVLPVLEGMIELMMEATPPDVACDALQPGDVVRLASGGPAMTVLSQLSAKLAEVGGWWACTWNQEATGEQRIIAFPAAALRKVEHEQARLEQTRAAYAVMDQGVAALAEAERYIVGSPAALRAAEVTEKIAEAKAALFSALAEDA